MGQRRFVTVMFSDICGSIEYAERLEVEEMSALLERFRQLADEIVPRHGGVIASYQGDGFMALFGHDMPREDDGRRATEAALELHAAVAGLKVRLDRVWRPLAMHTGIHGGLVLLVEGDIERGRLGVVGDVVHTASRLSAAAGTGQILVSAELLGPQLNFFEITWQRDLPIRGRKAAVSTVRVEGRAGVRRRIDAAARRGTVPFVGRQPLLDQLLGWARQPGKDVPQTALLVGEPGIGKTRLLDELARGLEGQADGDGLLVMRGHCESYLGAEPLQPMVQALRGALGWRADQAPAVARGQVLAGLSALDPAQREPATALALQLVGLGPEGAQAGLRITALVELMLALAGARRLVLLLDDWQWADDASRAALEALRDSGRPMFLLLATRPVSDDDHALVGMTMLRVPPLPAEAVEQAIEGWLPQADPFMVQEILSLAGGSPLYVEELCQVAMAGAVPLARDHRPAAAWIGSLVASRFERLPPAQAECLKRAAVVGAAVPQALLSRLCGPGRAEALAQVLDSDDFIVPAGPPGMLRFRHALTREAVYALVDADSRQALHLQVAQALEAGGSQLSGADPLDALAYHYDAAGVDGPAAQYAEAAGDRALASMALDRARALYITALGALDRMPELGQAQKARWCGIAQRLGQTCVFDPLDIAHSFELFQRAVQLAGELDDANVLARATYWLAYVNYGKGRPGDAVRHGEQALALAEASGDARLHAQVQATLAEALASAGRYERALPLFNQAVSNKRRHGKPGGSTAIGSAYALGRLGYTLGDLGRFDEAHAQFAEALDMLGDTVHSVRASVLELLCAVHLWQGRWSEAEAAGLDGAALALRCRSRYLTAMGRALAACGGWAARRDDASYQLLRDSTAWIEQRGGAVSTSLNHGWLVQAAVAQGRRAELRAHAAQLFRRARLQDRQGEAQGCRSLAAQALANGDAARAERYLLQAEAAAALRGSRREQALNRLARADQARWQGRKHEAGALAEAAAHEFAQMGMAWHLSQAQAQAQAQTEPQAHSALPSASAAWR